MCTRTTHVRHSFHLKSRTNECSQPAHAHLQGSCCGATLVTCQQLASPVMTSPRQQHVTPAEPDRTVQAGPNFHPLVELIQLYFAQHSNMNRNCGEHVTHGFGTERYRADVSEHLLVLKVTSDQTRTCCVVNSSNSFVNSSNGRQT